MDYYGGMKSSEDVEYTRNQMFAALRARGVVSARVEFSGGHDEGGADLILLEAIGKPDVELREHIFPRVRDDEGNIVYEEHAFHLPGGEDRIVRRPVERELTDEEKSEMKLAQALAAPVYDEYYSFAGDFSVSGEVVWEVESGSVKMNGKESVEQYENIEKEL